MTPNNFSRLESPDYGKHTLSSLKRIADALDVALVVRFVPFSQYINWLSGTPQVDEGLRPEALAVPSFESEEKTAVFSQETPKIWGIVEVAQTILVSKSNYDLPFVTNGTSRPIAQEIPASRIIERNIA